jgi:uncharacterized membrane protein YecN with MAPEG domain
MSIAAAFPAGQLRGKTGISVGDGGNIELLLAMRRHANFIEVVPLALIIIALSEMNGAPGWAIHAMGAVLTVAGCVARRFGSARKQCGVNIRAVLNRGQSTQNCV